MNYVQKMFAKFALKMAGVPGNMATYSTMDTGLYQALQRLQGSLSYTNKSIDDVTAMQISTVWSCNRILCETIGCLPSAVYESKGDNWVKTDHQVGQVLRLSPNTEMTGQEYIEALTANLNLQGNSYSFVSRGTGNEIISLFPIPSANVQPQQDKETGAVSFKVLDRGKWDVYPREKIWQVKGFGTNGLVGLSPIGYAKQSMGISLAMEEFSGRFFSQGAKAAGILRIPQFLNDAQRIEARKSLEGAWSGMENAHKMRLLEGGIEYEPVTMPLDDAQFLQSRGFQMEEICRIYRIPPHMVADLERATFSNIEQMSLEFVIYTLLPWLTRFESSISRWLFKPEDRARYRFRFNFDALLRGDSAARAALYSSALQNGYMTRNQVRVLENMNTSTDKGMDDYTVQTNMTPVSLLAQTILAQSAPKPAAPVAPTNPAPVKAGDFNFDLKLPDGFKHDLNHRIDLPSIVALANEVKRGNDKNELLIRLMDRGFSDLTEAIKAQGKTA